MDESHPHPPHIQQTVPLCGTEMMDGFTRVAVVDFDFVFIIDAAVIVDVDATVIVDAAVDIDAVVVIEDVAVIGAAVFLPPSSLKTL